MKKILSFALIAALLLCSLPAFAVTVSDVMQVANCVEWVSLRETASSSSMRLEKVHLGELVSSCSDAGNGFIECTFDGKTGYIMSKYLKTTTFSNWDTLLRNQQVVNCDEWVSLRDYPDTKANRLATVPKGATVTGCVAIGSDFIYCTYGGKSGYVLSKYLNNANYSDSSSGGSSSGSTSAVMYVTNCNSYVTLRKTASTSASKVAYVHKGELVKFISTAENGFYKVKYNGQTGYILANYLGKTSVSSSATILPNQVVSGVSTWVALRMAASSSSARLDKLTEGTIVTKCVKVGSWISCEVNGKKGYVYSAYLTNAY